MPHFDLIFSMLSLILLGSDAFSASCYSHVSPSPQDLEGSLFDEAQQAAYRKQQQRQRPSSYDYSVRPHATQSMDEMGVEIKIKRPARFVAPPFQCYVEDTDASGLMYHANCLQAYDRALRSMFMLNDNSLAEVLETCRNMIADGADIGGLQREKADQELDVETYSDWSIVNVEHQQFRNAIPLGCTYYVHGTLVDQPKPDQEVWDCTMRETNDPNSPILNFARVTIARPGTFVPPDNIVADYGLEKQDRVTSTKELFWLFRDELDAQFYHLPLRNALNLFERSRANFLGGPECLQRLKEDHGLIFVMTAINDMCKFPPSGGKNGQAVDLRPGQLVTIQTDIEVQREGAILVCHQTLLADDRPVAQASVTLMTLDVETFQPTSDLPDWLIETLMYGPQVKPATQRLSFQKSGVPKISPANGPKQSSNNNSEEDMDQSSQSAATYSEDERLEYPTGMDQSYDQSAPRPYSDEEWLEYPSAPCSEDEWLEYPSTPHSDAHC